MTDNPPNDSLLSMFIFETSNLTEQLEQMVLAGEGISSFHQGVIDEIFRITHTIKGSAAMMLYPNISNLAHSMEDIFYYLREEKPEFIEYSALSDLVLESIDFIKNEMEKIKNDGDAYADEGELTQKLKGFLAYLKKNNSAIPKEKEITEEADSLTDMEQDNLRLFKAVIHFEEGCGMENVRAFAVIHKLKELVKELHYYPEQLTQDSGTAEIISAEGFTIHLKTDLPYEVLYQFFQQTIFLKNLEFHQAEEESASDKPGIQRQIITEDIPATSEREAGGQYRETKDVFASMRENPSAMTQHSFISVSVSKLDKLLDLVGEMVITEAMVIKNPDLKDLELNNFNKSAHQLSKITNEIKDMVMSIRMVPLSATFHKMNRVVRDMCKKLNKEVRLEILGEETEVDKNIIEHISDPLMHLIRNAVDHGIEAEEERKRLGKSQAGTVTIEARNVGSDVLIVIKDDGRGLDKERIMKKARENQLLPMNADSISEKEIFNLILLPGFSTKDRITEYSGRGVGMDVVARNIEAVSGSISIDSSGGRGTAIVIKIPLTLAIIDAMNIRVGSSYYSIPTMSIRESFRLNENHKITYPDKNEMIMIRNQCYPVIRLHKLYDVTTEITDLSKGILIMIQQEERSVCLFADELIGQQQIVVKSLPKYLKSWKEIRGVTGCTLLGDGSISLILDVVVLVNQ